MEERVRPALHCVSLLLICKSEALKIGCITGSELRKQLEKAQIQYTEPVNQRHRGGTQTVSGTLESKTLHLAADLKPGSETLGLAFRSPCFPLSARPGQPGEESTTRRWLVLTKALGSACWMPVLKAPILSRGDTAHKGLQMD